MVEHDANATLSVIVRFHKGARLEWLDHALFSLATQQYQDLEVVLMVQDGDEALIRQVAQVIEEQPFLNQRHQIIHLSSTGQQKDIRSKLLNEGLRFARGRFLAFLDFDDVVYETIYNKLIARILATRATVAVGGCNLALLLTDDGDFPVVKSKHLYADPASDLADLFVENFIPIHTYVIDRFSLAPETNLLFNEEMVYLEDYLFLLRIAAKNTFDFFWLSSPLAEYRVRDDGSNSVDRNSITREKQDHWGAMQEFVEIEKEKIFKTLSLAELARIKKS